MALPLDTRPWTDQPWLIPLSCELEYAIERGLSVSDAIERHVKNFNFSPHLTNQLRSNRVEHEAAHLMLGLAFRHLRWNPTKMDFGYNGNEKAESLAIPIESLLIPIPETSAWPLAVYHSVLQDPAAAFPKFLKNHNYFFNRSFKNELDDIYRAAREANASPLPKSIFEVMRSHKFGFIGKLEDDPELGYSHTRHGERIPHPNMMREKEVCTLFDTLMPMVRLVLVRTLQRAQAEGLPPSGAIMRETLLAMRMDELEKAIHTPKEAMDYEVSSTLGGPPLQLGIKQLNDWQRSFLQISGLEISLEAQSSIAQRLQSALEKCAKPVEFLIARRVDEDLLRDHLKALYTAYRTGPSALERRNAREAMNTESLKLLDLYVEKGFSAALQSAEQRTHELYEIRPHGRISHPQPEGPVHFWGGLSF